MKIYSATKSAILLSSCLLSLLIAACIVSNVQAADNVRSLHTDTLEVLQQQANYRCPGCGSVAYGSAFVSVVDQDGNPVPFALVIAAWSGTDTRQMVSITNAFGWAAFFSEPVPFTSENSPSFTFCITTIIKTGFSYDPDQNALLCGSSD